MIKTVLQVNPNIEKFLNYGMKYIVWLRVDGLFHDEINAYFCKSEAEAIVKQKELQKIAIFPFWDA
jgi:hypothetical protein